MLNASNRYQGVAEPTVMQSLLLSVITFHVYLSVIAACKISKVHVKVQQLLRWRRSQRWRRLGFFRILKRISFTVRCSTYQVVRLPAGKSKKCHSPTMAKHPVIILMIIFLAFMQSMRYGVLFLSHEELYIMIAEYAIAHVSGFQYWFDYYLDHGQDLYLGVKLLRDL